MNLIGNKKIPPSIQNQAKWQSNRRQFFKLLLAGTVVTQIPWWMSCSPDDKTHSNYIFNQRQKEIIEIVQNFLFPSDGDGPGAKEINAKKYLQWVILDTEMDKDEIEYIFSGIKWIEETAQEEKETSFLQLNEKEQEEVLIFIAQQSWGESWYSVLLTFIFEALLSDPVYGSNPVGIGWKWLNHNSGDPRPGENQKYGRLLNHVNSIKQG